MRFLPSVLPHVTKLLTADHLQSGEWDPISKQPTFKSGAVNITKLGYKAREFGGEDKVAVKEPQTAAVNSTANTEAATTTVTQQDLTRRDRHLESWLGDTHECLDVLDDTFNSLLPKLASDSDAHSGIRALHLICGRIRARLQPQMQKFGEAIKGGPNHAVHALHESLFRHTDSGDGLLDVLATMRALHVLLAHGQACLAALVPVSQAIWDGEFFEAVKFANAEMERMQDWVKHQLQVRAPQTLLVPALQ